MRIVRATIAALLAAMALAGCSGGLPGFGGPKSAQPDVVVDPNLYPSNYRLQITDLLTTQLTDREDFRNTLISPPALKPVADSSNPHYVVCLQFNGRAGQRIKVVIFLGGLPTQFIDATPEQCAGVPYQSFTELASRQPSTK
jgi:hypothetical protein